MLDQLPPAIREQLDVLLPQLLEGGVNLLTAVVILIAGFWFAGRVRVWTMRALGRWPNMDEMLQNFFGTIARYLVLTFTIVAVLAKFGVQTASLIAVLGAAGLAVGLALQGTLSNVAAGVMLIIFRPYKIGQYVDIGGTSGTVKDLNIFVTELVTPDNVQIIMPNGKAWGTVITNFSAHSTRRLDLTFGIDYDDDIDKAVQIILDVANADERVHKDPEPWVRLTNLGDSSVDLGVRLWCDAGNYWELKFHMLKSVKEAFDAGGISIPYPHSVEIQKAG